MFADFKSINFKTKASMTQFFTHCPYQSSAREKKTVHKGIIRPLSPSTYNEISIAFHNFALHHSAYLFQSIHLKLSICLDSSQVSSIASKLNRLVSPPKLEEAATSIC